MLAVLCLSMAGTVCAADTERSGDPRRPERDAAPRAESAQSLDRLRAELRELTAANKLDEAEQVKKRIAELERARPAPLPRRELADMEERARLMDEEIKELRRLGEDREAERLERERNSIRERIQMAREQGDLPRPPMLREGGRMDAPIESERRMQHLRVAIENLRAAGLPDEAARLERVARQMQMGPMDGQPGMPGEMRPGGQGAPNQERMDRMEADIRELRQMVRELQRQLR